MKQMINEINLQGYVFSIGGRDGSLYHGRTSAESKIPNTDYVSGNLNIATDDDGMNVVPVRFNFITPTFSKSGKENPNWGVLHDIEVNDATWDKKGRDGAYMIRLNCQAGSNPFVGQDGNIVDRPNIDVSFAHPSNQGFNQNQRNTFKFDMMMIAYIPQEVEDGEDYGKIHGYVFNTFRKEAIPVELVIRQKGGMEYFENLNASNANPVGITVWGKIVSTTIEHKREIESAFGDPQVEISTTTTREWVIDGCSPDVHTLDESDFMTEDELIECINNHEVIVAAAKERAEARNSASTNGPSAFGSEPAPAPKRTFGANDFKF